MITPFLRVDVLSLRSEEFNKMTRHSSYGKTSKGAKKRNVLKRYERIDVLRKLGRWTDGQNKQVTGLPKTPVV